MEGDRYDALEQTVVRQSVGGFLGLALLTLWRRAGDA